MLRLFPLLVLPVVLYNIVALGGGAFMHLNDVQDMLHTAVTIPLFSGQKPAWEFNLGDFLVLVTLALLFIEVVKATRTTSREIINHGL